jgi:hypothetical protein
MVNALVVEDLLKPAAMVEVQQMKNTETALKQYM